MGVPCRFMSRIQTPGFTGIGLRWCGHGFSLLLAATFLAPAALVAAQPTAGKPAEPSLAAPQGVQAASPPAADPKPAPPTPPTFGQAESPVKSIVFLFNGAKYCGRIQQEVSGSHITIQLATGETKRFSAQEVMRVRPVLAADAAGSEPDTRLDRTVVLIDGSMVRGELVEHVPGDHLTLFLPGGWIRRLDLAKIDKVEQSPPLPSGASTASGPRTRLVHAGLPYEGDVVEYVPELLLVLRLDSGEIKRFPWPQIQQLTGFRPVRALSAEERQVARQLSLGRIYVTIRPAKPGMQLKRFKYKNTVLVPGANGVPVAGSGPPVYETICDAPCNSWFDPDDLTKRYIISGNGVSDSDQFVPAERAWGAHSLTFKVVIEDGFIFNKAIVTIEAGELPTGRR